MCVSQYASGTGGSDDRVDVGMLLQRVHALFLVQVEADALLYHVVNLNQEPQNYATKTLSFDPFFGDHGRVCTYHSDVRC